MRRVTRGDCSRSRMHPASSSDVLPCALGPTIKLSSGANSVANRSKQRKWRTAIRSRAIGFLGRGSSTDYEDYTGPRIVTGPHHATTTPAVRLLTIQEDSHRGVRSMLSVAAREPLGIAANDANWKRRRRRWLLDGVLHLRSAPTLPRRNCVQDDRAVAL